MKARASDLVVRNSFAEFALALTTRPTHCLGSLAWFTFKKFSSTDIRNRVAHIAQSIAARPIAPTTHPTQGASSPNARSNEAPINAIRPKQVMTAHHGQKLVSWYRRIRVNDYPTYAN